MEDNKSDIAYGKPENVQMSVKSLIGLLYDKIRENRKFFRIIQLSAGILAGIVSFIAFAVLLLYVIPGLQETFSRQNPGYVNDPGLKDDQNYKKQISALNRDIQRLSKKYASYTSGQSYIVINTTYNRFFLHINKKLVREGTCSTGSYKRLQTVEGRSWTFKTPRGKFEIQGKRINPTWHKPDWAFVEEGLPIPSKDSPLRWEPYVLGDYALDLGDGYLIHGTIYKRQLGMPVTHGCVRLNDEDLEAVFRTLNIGSKVYIF